MGTRQPARAGLGARLAAPGRPLLLFSMTPPRQNTPEADRARIAEVMTGRLRDLDLDALILYDIEDESDRNPQERPFPYLPTMDPADFRTHLTGWDGPVVVYRTVGKYEPTELKQWLTDQDPDRVATVLVGASTGSTRVRTRLAEAQSLWRDSGAALPLGAVAIPERHAARGDEHDRMLRKQAAGTSFFVTQVVYDIDAAKDLVSDYYYACVDRGVRPAPLVFTLSVCGSLRTLDFLQWLGVNLPRWLLNQLERAEDPLAESLRQCAEIAAGLADFCTRLGMPFGFNIESVSIRRVEIDASVQLAAHVREALVGR